MSRPVSVSLSVALSHRLYSRSVVHTLGTLAVAAGLTLVVGCGQDVTEPAAARPTAAGAKALMSMSTGGSVWNGKIVSIQSQLSNPARQAVCLDIPWGVASVNQDVNYFPCHFGPAQQFVLTAWDAPNGGSWVMIRPVSNSSVCFDMRGGTTTGGEHLQLFTCKSRNAAGAGNQIFKLPAAAASPAGGGLLMTTICPQAGYPSLALEVPLPIAGSSFTRQLTLTGDWNQLWSIKDLQSGQYFRTADLVGQSVRTC